jgi:predicted DNA-binding transcriptional regulator YafY
VTSPKCGRKQSDAGKLLRLFRLLNLLWNTPAGLRVEEIASVQEISKRTAYRDLEILEQSGFVLSQDARSGRFRLQQARDSAGLLGFDRVEADILLHSLAASPPTKMRDRLLTKLRALGTPAGLLSKAGTTASVHSPYSHLHEAIRLRQCVILMAYRSANSHTERNRSIEPYAFTEDLSAVMAYEPSASANKTFKLERIGEVRVLNENWRHEHRHQKIERDPFGMPFGVDATEIHLQLGELSAQLFREEFPAFAPLLQQLPQHPSDAPVWDLRVRAGNLQGIGRFVLGLIDDIQILGPASFKAYLKTRIGHKLR